MSFCTHCGAENIDGTKFCTSCGQPLDKGEGSAACTQASDPSPAQSSSASPSIATQMDVVGAAGTAGASAVAKPGGFNKGIAAIIAVLVAAVVVVVLFATGIISFDTRVDEKSFPNGVLRQAVLDNVDTDGNGLLSQEEKDAVTTFAYNGSAAIFVADSGSVDVEQVQKELSSKGAASDAVQEDVFESLKMFPNITTVVAPDAELTEVDMSAIPEAEYIDLRGNDIAELDLSGSSNIRSLFCDPSVQLVGLAEANLYYRDLLTSYTRGYGSSTSDTTSISYDTYGRPVEKSDKYSSEVYIYDDQGRLTARKNKNNSSQVFNTYTYNDDGAMASWTRYANTYDDTKERITFSYDEQGLPLRITTSEGVSCDLVYDGNVLSSANSKTELSMNVLHTSMQFSYENGLLTKNAVSNTSETSSSGSWNYDETATYSYSQDGVLSDVVSVGSSAKSVTTTNDTKLSFSANGFPQEIISTLLYEDLSTTSSKESYECNSDGYITKTVSAYDGSSINSTTAYDYVKFVSSYDLLTSMFYVPTIRCSIDSAAIGVGWYSPICYMASEDLSLGDRSVFGVESFGPQCFNAWLTGLDPQFLENANERAIREKAVELYKQEMASK